jgi:hypothetical protein
VKFFVSEASKADARGRGLLVLVHVIIAVGILKACYLTGTALNLKIGFKYLDVDELALRRAGAIRTGEIQCEVAVMGQDEAVHLSNHYVNTSVHLK